MTLLQEIAAQVSLNEAKKQLETPTVRNFVAKNSQSKSGAGAHEAKRGEKASRSRRNANWKKEAARDM